MRILYLLLFLSIISCNKKDNEATSEATLPEIKLPEGFTATMLYSPTDHGQGSWVSITGSPDGRLWTSDQYGKIYSVRINGNEVTVDSLNMNVGSAQGLLWAHDGLYVTVNSRKDADHEGSGLFKLTDSNNDNQLDTAEKLLSLDGDGEHGPHGIILGPDGESLYLVAGNHTLVPESFGSVLNGNWREDRLFPALLDPRGHANEIRPPGGWIARSDDHGKTWTVIASGFRNAYDIAFNQNGDLFTFDSDMEWDLGTPWYRPTRVCHVIPGAEFGWRTGSGKWPAYYPDNLPPVLEIGQGSPTGITFGYGSSFPGEYQNSLFISDWSFGTIYQVDLQHSGASYTAEKKEFLSGTPLAVTDLIVASDGNLYFTTGGRRGTSYLYRVSHEGTPNAQTVSGTSGMTPEQKLLREILNNPGLDQVWAGLQSEDRFIRYASRVALEKGEFDTWIERYKTEENENALIQASIAAIRQNQPESGALIFQRLNTIPLADLSLQEKLDLVRAYGLYFSRFGKNTSATIKNLPEFPSGNPALDRELCELYAFLGDGSIILPTLDLMEKAEASIEADLTPVDVLERSEQYGPTIKAMHENRPAEQGIAFAMALSHLKNGWTEKSRERYFKWFYRALQKSGGMSYTGFVENIRQQALNNVPDKERDVLAEISGEALLGKPLVNPDIPPPTGPGRNWIISEALNAVNDQLSSADLKRGEELYQATLCASCHMMDGKGGNTGPDLTQAGTRFSNYDLLMSIINPSVSISDQYAATLFTFKDGTTLVGRTLRSTADSVYVNTNPFGNDAVALSKEAIEKEEVSPVSLMPGGLINSLNESELRALMAYLTKSR